MRIYRRLRAFVAGILIAFAGLIKPEEIEQLVEDGIEAESARNKKKAISNYVKNNTNSKPKEKPIQPTKGCFCCYGSGLATGPVKRRHKAHTRKDPCQVCKGSGRIIIATGKPAPKIQEQKS